MIRDQRRFDQKKSEPIKQKLNYEYVYSSVNGSIGNKIIEKAINAMIIIRSIYLCTVGLQVCFLNENGCVLSVQRAYKMFVFLSFPNQ